MNIDEFKSEIEAKRPSYRKIQIPKHNGSMREIFIPDDLTLDIQKAILHDIDERVIFKPCVMAFKKDTSILDNAKAHMGHDYLIRYDLKDFFDNISKARVKSVLESINFEPAFVKIILKWCLYRNHLPQGAATSPILSNLVCTSIDYRFTKLARKINATYTRYADDIIISGGKNIMQYQTIFKRIIRTEHFIINHKKTKITALDSYVTRQADPNLHWFRLCHNVTGLALDKDTIHVRQSYIDDLSYHIRKVSEGKEHLKKEHLKGRINFVWYINHEDAKNLYQKFDSLFQNINS